MSGEATNEIGSAFVFATPIPVSLPAPIFGPAAGGNAGLPCRPSHAYITVEGGDVRYRLDGSEVAEPFGLLAKDGTAIDWTNPLYNFASFISRCRVIAANGATQVLLNISWRD